MRSEDGFAVWGAGEPGKAEADAPGPVVSTESVPCLGLLEGVGWATLVAAAGASAEPAPTSVGTAKTGSEIVVDCRQSLPAAGIAIDGVDGCRNTSDESPRRSRKVVNPQTWPVCTQKSAGVKGSPPKTVLSVRGTSPPKPTPVIGEEGVGSPQAHIRYIPPSWSRSAKG